VSVTNKILLSARILSCAVLAAALAGCATTTMYVPPTGQELQAVRPFKKTVAVLIAQDSGMGSTQWTGIEALESVLAPYYEILDRPRIQSTLADPAMNGLREEDLAYRAGKSLRADYTIFATIRSSSPLPARLADVGNICVQSTIHVNMYDVAAGKRAFAGVLTREACHTVDNNLPELIRNGQASVDGVLGALRASSEMGRILPAVTQEARDEAVAAAAEAMKAVNPLEGEVLKVLSDREVMVNLGSAYGVVPGTYLTVFAAGKKTSIKDPKTGLLVEGRESAADLWVTKVTSGISSVAEGDKKLIARVRAGDKVVS